MAENKKGKLFGVINILDFLIILILVAVVACAGFFFWWSKRAPEGTVPLTYVVEVTACEEPYFDYLVEGETVKNGRNEEMGTITKVEKLPYTIVNTNQEEGVFQQQEIADKWNAHVTIQTKAALEGPDLMVGEESVKVGKSVTMRSASAAISGFVIQMDFSDDLVKEAAQ